MSDIRFNQWLHNSGTGGVSQVDGGHVGIGTTNPLIPVGSGNTAILNVGVVTANSFYGDGSNLSGIVGGGTSLSFNDNIGAYFGNSQDLKIYHDGNHSYIDDQGTGNLRFRSGTLEILNLAGNKTSAIFSSGGGQTLNFNNSTKFVTTNTGAVVTGILTSTQLEVTTGANSFETSANVFKGTSGQKGVYLRSALSSATTPSYSSVDDTNTGIFLPGSDVFAVTTGGTERLRITSTGKVNIGDTQMSQNIFNIEDGTAAALDIASHGSGGDTAYIGVKKSDGGGLTIGISNRDIIFKTGATYSSGTVFDSGNEKVRITSAGSMGVGTNTPDRKLDVSGTGNVYGKFQSTNATGAGIEVKDISEDWLIQADGGSLDGLAFYDLGRTSYRFIMGNAGQFGVGSGSGRYGLTRQALVSGGGSAAPSWSSNPLLLDMAGLGDIDYDGVFLRYRETATVTGNGLIYLGLCKSTTNCPAGRIGIPVGFIPSTVYNGHFRVDKVGITPWPDGSGHRYEFYAIISDYVSSGKLGVFYLTNSTN